MALMHINEHVSGDDCFPNLNELAYLGYFLRRNSILDSYICEIHESTLLGLAWLGLVAMTCRVIN
jgi:hypothetical protein